MTRRLDGDGLPVTSGTYDQTGRKPGTVNFRLDLTTTHAADTLPEALRLVSVQLPLSVPPSETMLALTSNR